MNLFKKIVFHVLILVGLSVAAFGGAKMNAEAKVIYTTSSKVNAAAAKIIRKASKEGMTNEEKLYSTYVYLVKHMHYSHSKGPVRVKVTKADKAYLKTQVQTLGVSEKIVYSSQFKKRYSNVLTLQGTCYDMSMVYCIIANQLGYKAGMCSGRYVRGNGSTCEHWWNYVVVNGKKKYFDVQAANASWKSHHSIKAINKFYKKNKSDKVWKRHHRG